MLNLEGYGRRFEGDRLWWIGYSEKKPDATWCKEHVSEVTGAFQSVAWLDELKAWAITFTAPMNVLETNPGTFPGTTGIEW
jgi:hypothetical protein